MEDTQPRESLLTPSMRHSSSKASLRSGTTPSSSSGTLATSPSTTSTGSKSLQVGVDMDAKPLPAVKGGPRPPDTAAFNRIQAVSHSLMDRTPFAIDDAKDGDEDSDEDSDDDVEPDDQVMDEVCALLDCVLTELTDTHLG